MFSQQIESAITLHSPSTVYAIFFTLKTYRISSSFMSKTLHLHLFFWMCWSFSVYVQGAHYILCFFPTIATIFPAPDPVCELSFCIISLCQCFYSQPLEAKSVNKRIGWNIQHISRETRSRDLKSYEKNLIAMELLSLQNSCLLFNQLC